MIRKLFLLLMISFIASSCSTTSVSHNQKPNAAVIVTGVGFDLESAKSQAIRTALALKTNQTIVTEQLLLKDELQTDMLASSMSGHLSFFKVLEQTIDENGFVTILAEVGIRNKTKKQKKSLYRTDSGKRVNGLEISNQISSAKALLEAKKLHKKLQFENAKKLSLTLLSGYIPAMQANLDEIKVDPANPEEVTLKLSYALKNNWVKKQKERSGLIETFWSNKKSWNDNSSYDEHLIFICEDKLFSNNCTHLPTNPKQEIKNIVINIPVFSTSGEYLTCIRSYKVNSPVSKYRTNRGQYTTSNYMREGYTSYWFDAGTMRYSLKVRSDKLYSANKKAEFFYPFIASEGLDSISACEIEGRKMHVASGNKIFTSSVNLISKASASNRLQERSKDKAYAPISFNETRKKYFSNPGSKIKIIKY